MIRRLLKVPARMLLIALAGFSMAVAVSALSGARPEQPAETIGNKVPASNLEVVNYDVDRGGWTYELKGNLLSGAPVRH